jgi:hypothetical protein
LQLGSHHWHILTLSRIQSLPQATPHFSFVHLRVLGG